LGTRDFASIGGKRVEGKKWDARRVWKEVDLWGRCRGKGVKTMEVRGEVHGGEEKGESSAFETDPALVRLALADPTAHKGEL